jgi:hypothetical protein
MTSKDIKLNLRRSPEGLGCGDPKVQTPGRMTLYLSYDFRHFQDRSRGRNIPPMEGPEAKANIVPMPRVRKLRLRRWAKCSLWVAGTSLVLLDCGVHGLIKPLAFVSHMVRSDREMQNVANAPESAPSSIGARDDDLYLAPGLRSGSFE